MKKTVVLIIVVALISLIATTYFLIRATNDGQRKVNNTPISNTQVEATNVPTTTAAPSVENEVTINEIIDTSGEISGDSGENEVIENSGDQETNSKDYDKQVLEETETASKPTLYFFKNSFVGYFQDGKWEAPKDIRLGDIFDNDHYTLYSTKYKKYKSTNIKLSLGGGYNGFSYVGQATEHDDETGTTTDNVLGSFASVVDDDGYIFELPNKLDEKLYNTNTVNLNDIQISSVTMLADGVNYDGKDNVSNLIAFNEDYSLRFENESRMIPIPEEVVEFVKEQCEKNGIKEGVEYSLDSYYRLDLNHDNVFDDIFVIVSDDATILRDSNGSDYWEATQKLIEYGGFSMILTRINGKLSIVKDCYIRNDEPENLFGGDTFTYSLEVVDLNNDGIYEILYSTSGYEFWWDSLAVYEDEGYKSF